MKNISELEEILKGFLGCYKTYVNCLAKMLIALYTVRTINLSEIAEAMTGKAKQESHYRRLQRFFQYVRFDYDFLARGIVKLFFLNEEGPWYLALDRTNWKFGKKDTNILVLTIVKDNIAIPVLWSLLNHGGCTSAKQKWMLIDRFIKLFGKGKIAGLLADREFASKEFFRILVWKKIPFFIRVKENSLVESKEGKKNKVRKLFNNLRQGEKQTLKGRYVIFNRELYHSEKIISY